MKLEPVNDLYESSHPDVAGVQRVPLGRIWSRNFPGSVGLYDVVDLNTHSVGYIAGRPPTYAKAWSLLGFVSEVQLTDMVSLQEALDGAVDEMRLSGRDIRAPSFAVDAVAAFLEPAGGTFRRRSWPLYEIDLVDGSYRYSTSPDRWATLATRSPVVTAVAALPVDGAGYASGSLHEVPYGDSDSFGYLSGPVELAATLAAMPAGERGQTLLGDVTERPGQNLPLVRLRPGPGCPDPGPPGHRLAVDWQALAGEGHEPEGVVGFVDRPDNDRLPLLRWRCVADRTLSILTLGARPDSPERWAFDATICAAWRSDVRRPGLIDLYELTRGALTAYDTQPSELEAAGFAVHRVICRIHEEQEPGTVPLALDVDGAFPSVSQHARTESGNGSRRVVGFVDPAVPPMPVTAASANLPGWAVVLAFIDPFGRDVAGLLSREPFRGSVVVVDEGDGSIGVRRGQSGESLRVLGHASSGPTAFGVPLYRVRPRSGGASYLTSSLGEDHGGVVEDTACYLFTPDSGPPGTYAPPVSDRLIDRKPEARSWAARWRALRADS